MDARDDAVPVPARTVHWQQATDRQARYAWCVLLAAITVALVGGIISAATEQPDATVPDAEVDECAAPPCFEIGAMPGVRDLPVVVPTLGYLLAIVLSLPSVFTADSDILRGRWAPGGRQMAWISETGGMHWITRSSARCPWGSSTG